MLCCAESALITDNAKRCTFQVTDDEMVALNLFMTHIAQHYCTFQVTDNDVVASLLTKGVLSVDGIMRVMAIDEMGDAAWFRQHLDQETDE